MNCADCRKAIDRTDATAVVYPGGVLRRGDCATLVSQLGPWPPRVVVYEHVEEPREIWERRHAEMWGRVFDNVINGRQRP